MFQVEDFIRESNKIDIQHDERGSIISGAKPGDMMYDNQIRALELIPALRVVNPTPAYIPLVLHRELTRGISVYEDTGNSGAYRQCDVWIGGEKAPNPMLAQRIIKEILIPEIEEFRLRKEVIDEDAVKFAWRCHDLFECAHPFIDGNGRTGRLLLNVVLEFLGQEKQTIWYNQRFDYYQKIREFRNAVFPDLLAKMLDVTRPQEGLCAEQRHNTNEFK